MIDFPEAVKSIEEAISSKKMLIIVGNMAVEYWGRAASKLPKGKRMLLIKGDSSFAIHQNRLLRPVNYMMGAKISHKVDNGTLVLEAKKTNPKESIKVFFYSVDFLKSFGMSDPADLRLFGSEKELSDQLAQDLSFIEPGLKPFKREGMFRKGVVDLLAEDKDGKLVVIEVKRRQASYNAVSQLHRYMKQVEKMKNRKTRGILIAPEITKPAHELLENYGLEFVSLDFEIGNPQATIKGLEKKQKTLFD